MGSEEYVHAIGQQLETCTDSRLRAELARLLGATGSPDAQPYLVEAISEETDAETRQALRDALAALDAAFD